jgi:hypothetical protein
MVDRILGMRTQFAVFLLIVLYTIAPVLAVLASSVAANALGCRLDESGVHPGREKGEKGGEKGDILL